VRLIRPERAYQKRNGIEVALGVTFTGALLFTALKGEAEGKGPGANKNARTTSANSVAQNFISLKGCNQPLIKTPADC